MKTSFREDTDDLGLDAVDAAPAKVENRVPCLMVIRGPQLGRVFPLVNQATLIGRASEANIVIDDAGISRHHARLTVEGNQIVLTDLGSRNGTVYNGERLSAAVVLSEGGNVQLGRSTVLKFTWQDPEQEGILRHQYALATRDSLTGCFNRHYLTEQLAAEFAHSARFNRPLGVLFLDIDRFKAVNDAYGHTAGDTVLQHVGKILMSACRKSETVARYGGEEFVALLRDTTLEAAHQVGDRWRKMLADAEIPHQAAPLKITVSIGVASTSQGPVAKATDLIKAADAKLYIAKNGGRNRVA